ncbi:MAG: sigma-54-dependent Fis family transcriptional regulator [Nitrospinae bacterium]|nr:sigma-54-dependent Fis family transcriptional regulator [Nitrospinota bacterium]
MSDTAKQKILVVDDEESLRLVLSRSLKRKGYDVDTAESIAEARELLNERSYSIGFFDIALPDGSGLDLLDSVKNRSNPPSVVIITAQATMKNAIEAMRRGAFDYLTKPFDLDEVEALTSRIMDYRKMAQELAMLKSARPAAPSVGEIVGRSPALQEVFKLIGKLADSDVTALITGPTGSGKELIAGALHQNSPRAKHPFITVNCAAIPGELLESELFGHVKGAFTGAVEDRKGKFQSAGAGTIFLDEVGELPLSLQAKLLRVLQEREFYPVGSARPVRSEARVLAATNRDLSEEVASGRFREDLYHRINVARIELPPLCQRKGDIPALVNHFLEQTARAVGAEPKSVSPTAMGILAGYDWPGNVRELSNAIRRAALMAPGSVITVEDISPEIGGSKGAARPEDALARSVRELMELHAEGEIYDAVVKRVEKALIENALKKTGGVQAHAAKLLGVNRNTLMKKIAEFGVRLNEDSPNDGR